MNARPAASPPPAPSARSAPLAAALVALAVGVAAFAPAAQAAPGLAGALRGSPFQFFTEEDTRQFLSTGRALVDLPDGESRRWANEATGAWGTMTVTRSFKRNAAPCREVRGENTARGRTEPFRLVACKNPKGEWRIASSGAPPPARKAP